MAKFFFRGPFILGGFFPFALSMFVFSLTTT